MSFLHAPAKTLLLLLMLWGCDSPNRNSGPISVKNFIESDFHNRNRSLVVYGSLEFVDGEFIIQDEEFVEFKIYLQGLDDDCKNSLIREENIWINIIPKTGYCEKTHQFIQTIILWKEIFKEKSRQDSCVIFRYQMNRVSFHLKNLTYYCKNSS